MPSLTIDVDGVVVQDQEISQLSPSGIALVWAMLAETELLTEDRVIVPIERQPFGHIGVVFTIERGGEVIEVSVTTQGEQWDTPEATTLLELADQLKHLPEILAPEAWIEG